MAHPLLATTTSPILILSFSLCSSLLLFIQVMFETDKLTDALILEQGFVSLAKLQKTEATRA